MQEQGEKFVNRDDNDEEEEKEDAGGQRMSYLSQKIQTKRT